MEILIIERTDITRLIGMDWMKVTFKLTINKIQLAENSQSERDRMFREVQDFFEYNETIQDTEINIIQLKPGHYLVKQIAIPVPLHLQENVGK